MLITTTAKKKNQKHIIINFKSHHNNAIHRKMQYLLLEGAKKLRKKLIPTLPTSTRPRKKKTQMWIVDNTSRKPATSHTTKCYPQKLIPKVVSQSCAPIVVPKRRHRKLARA